MHTITRGYVVLVALIFFAIFLTVTTAFVGYLTAYARAERHAVASSQALALAEGGIDKAVYELNQNGAYAEETNVPLGAGTYSITVTSGDGAMKKVVATGYVPNAASPLATKTVTANVGIDTTVVSFRYGVQVGQGGVAMSNSARIIGNMQASGPITLANSSRIEGDAISAGAAGLIDGVESTITGGAYAHTLRDLDVVGDAYYVIASNVEAGGANCPNSHCHPGSPDQETAPLPISDEQIAEWEAAAEEGGVIQGDYTINNNQQLGPRKINGKLTVNGTLTLAGPVWVNGDITLNNDATLTVAAGLGGSGAILIADYPSDRAGKGAVTLSNNIVISGNGSPGSFPMIISMKSSGTVITLSNNADSVILYAPHGRISVSNSASANQITAYGLTLSNSATLSYLSGLQNANFSNGPGGSWAFIPGTYSIR